MERLTILAGATLCATAATLEPPLTALWLPGTCLAVWGWARLEQARTRRDQARVERYLEIRRAESAGTLRQQRRDAAPVDLRHSRSGTPEDIRRMYEQS